MRNSAAIPTVLNLLKSKSVVRWPRRDSTLARRVLHSEIGGWKLNPIKETDNAMKKIATLFATLALALTLGAPVFASPTPAPKKATTTSVAKTKKAKKHHWTKRHATKKAKTAHKA